MATEKIKNKIIIAGAGLVGTSFALCMANEFVSIELLETHLPELFTQSTTPSRPLSLSFGSYRILNAIGVWDKLEKFACPILSVHVSEKNRLGFTHFSAQEEKVPALGFVVPFAKLQSALYEKINSHPHITITPIQSVETIKQDDQGANITIQTLAEKKEIHADLFIAADGTHSHCRDLLKIAHTKKDHADVAQIYQLTLSQHHHHTAYERFTQWGVLAVLPLFEKNCAQLVWTITPRIAKKINAWTEKDILFFLQDVFDGRLCIIDAKKLTQFPLQTIIAEKQITQSALLIGNAAHTIYPVAAQGFNLALHDIAILCDTLNEALKNNEKLGSSVYLKKYETTAAKHQQAIFKITHQWVSLFELPFISHARGLGLLATNLIAPIKNKLAKRTMGIAEKLPRFLRGHHE
ncbi:MAG: 2-octaprenyl-6-methoxyphenyl hydroxylase [Gammaproteobacteria bacterium CG_4_10_14_0_8_um_filter_38_16]|nr:MAG: 2-octaprenyl-6-methoxyphenyl hydroxylase [Gammaproteobacteria bacterium CG_4_10_14_0_8_um_filter_38_16]PJA03910.1 MAG: 2-octaprenyl-6-methoxyphenyl hydroxylase [Gammaproteobacteria bacterium CG_4_10_14_0_2_um_filter_38_22]PJB09579.1 MAG: 2-octaprenyl-6-methoxyphenyl hydroxylase [Gammaproteobacteria bacterium CG_4_9_14_3_um_filter_38_9]